MCKEDIIVKIQKLLALSQSSNEHEAALALENANKLLMKHNLEMSDVDGIRSDDMIKDSFLSGGRIMNWKKTLLSSIAKLNNCDIVISSTRSRGYACRSKSESELIILGKKGNVLVTKEMFKYVEQAMERGIKRNKQLDKNSYHIGFTDAISKKVIHIMTEREMQNNPNVAERGLVIQEQAMTKKFMQEAFSNLSKTSVKMSYRDGRSYQEGKAHGEKTSLCNQMN
jgi:hypothetical protein